MFQLSYYEFRQGLLQNVVTITNESKIYYRLGQLLQIRASITNWDNYWPFKRQPHEMVEHTQTLIFS